MVLLSIAGQSVLRYISRMTPTLVFLFQQSFAYSCLLPFQRKRDVAFHISFKNHMSIISIRMAPVL